MKIHPTAIVSSRADLGEDVHIGPNSIVGENVVIGNNTWIDNGVVLQRNVRIGSRCRIHTGAVLGADPQDLKYKGENTFLEIGDRTIIREYVTVNLGTSQKGKTVIGSDVMLMAYAHVAHDCEVGDKVVLANSVALAGHVEIGEYVVVGGIVPIHQFVKIGCHAIIGGGYRVVKDVCPYAKAAGYPLRVVGLNTVGLKRRGFSPETMAILKKAYVLLFRRQLNVSQAMRRITDEIKQTPEILKLLNFIASSQRGIVR